MHFNLPFNPYYGFMSNNDVGYSLFDCPPAPVAHSGSHQTKIQFPKRKFSAKGTEMDSKRAKKTESAPDNAAACANWYSPYNMFQPPTMPPAMPPVMPPNSYNMFQPHYLFLQQQQQIESLRAQMQKQDKVANSRQNLGWSPGKYGKR